MNRKLLLISVLTVLLLAIPAIGAVPQDDPSDVASADNLQVSVWNNYFTFHEPEVNLNPVNSFYEIDFHDGQGRNTEWDISAVQVEALDDYILERAPWDGVEVTGEWEEVPSPALFYDEDPRWPDVDFSEVSSYLWRASAPDYVNPVPCSDEILVTADISINFLESPLAFDKVFSIDVSGNPADHNICGFEVFLKVDCASSSDYGVWYWEDPYWLPMEVELFSDGDNCYITFLDDVFDRVYGFGKKPEPVERSGELDGTPYTVTLIPCPGVGEINASFDIMAIAIEDLTSEQVEDLNLEEVTSEDVLFFAFDFEDPTGICSIQLCWESEETCGELGDMVVFYFNEGEWLQIDKNCDDSSVPTIICFSIDDPVLIEELLTDYAGIFGVGGDFVFIESSPGGGSGGNGGGGCNVGGFSAGLLLLALPLFTLFRK